jgi:hypothetical protein
MATPSLPEAAQAGHLSRVLGTPVSAVEVVASFPTVLSYIFRLRLAFDGDAGSAPQSLILKAGLIDRPGGPWRPGQREVAFYREIASEMPGGSLLRCFDTGADAETGAWHLLLEDLSDTHRIATQWPLPPTHQQCEMIVRAQARFHAAWWNDPRLGVSIGETFEPSMEELAALVEGFTKAFGDRLSSGRRDLHARLLASAPQLLAHPRPQTITHGDAHVWNCFLPREPNGTARLFDWDAWRLGGGTDDLSYMMAMHWYPDLRHQIESPLLEAYHDELVAAGVHDYGRAALQDDYRRSVLWLLTRVFWQQSIGIPPVIWWNNLERLHMAVDDLGCRDLL